MSKAPKIVYLQWHSHDYIDITWCEDKLEDTDVEYIRRDIADKMLAACKAALFYIDHQLIDKDSVQVTEILESAIAEAEGEE